MTHAVTPDARALVDELLHEAAARGASDIHLDPDASGYAVRYRLDGLLETQRRLEGATGRAAVTRLMVMAELLTYRLDIPQEGRLTTTKMTTTAGASGGTELRLAVMPTVDGLRAVVRLPAEMHAAARLDALGLPGGVEAMLRRFIAADLGLLLLTGPAGSGKTTTIYALLQEIAAARAGLSIVTLEDPVERRIGPGVVQIEVQPHGELTYERALRSMLRQDPQVLMLGEIRDAATASIAVQAALSGHRLVATLHAGTPEMALTRLMEMGVEPYQVTSAVFGVVSQRLLRRKAGGEYRGRFPVAEAAAMSEAMRQAVLRRSDAATLRAAIETEPGFVSLAAAARTAVERGVTDEKEVQRVLGGGA